MIKITATCFWFIGAFYTTFKTFWQGVIENQPDKIENNSMPIFIILGLFLLIFLFSPQKTVLAQWPMYRYDFSHSGSVTFSITETPEEKWVTQNIGFVRSPPVTDLLGNIYINADSGGLVVLNKNGQKKWSSNTYYPSNSPTIDENSNIYYSSGGYPSHVYSFDPYGNKRWGYSLGGWGGNNVPTGVSLSRNKDTLYVGVGYPTQTLLALNLDGSLKWQTNSNYQSPSSSPTVGPDGTIYIGTGSTGGLLAFSSNGIIKWHRNTSSYGIGSITIGSDNNIYVLTSNGAGGLLLSYDPQGNKKWSFQHTALFDGEGAFKSNIIYVASQNKLLAINTSGNLVWEWTAPAQGIYTLKSPVIDKNGVIYTAMGNKFYAISPEGTKKWELTLSSSLGAPIIAEDNLIYIYHNSPGWTGYLHALGANQVAKTYYPVIFIPGIGGSEFQLSQDFIWSKEDGHGGTFSHAYTLGEKVWVNESEAAMPGEDDYFDVLRLKSDGQTSEAPLELSGNLTPLGYSDIDPFFSDLGYTKGTNFFVFPYDWRKDIRTTESSLDALIEGVKLKSGMPKVNIVAHSMGGLVARNYISTPEKAAKVNKLIELGVPHLGSVDSLKAILYGTWFAKDYYLFKLGIIPSETYDVSQNLPGVFQLLPSKEYYNFYDNSDRTRPFPFHDDRDIDNNQVTGSLNSDQTKTLISNLNRNMTIYNFGEQFHNTLDLLLNNPNGTKVYEIVGSGKDTTGQIRETWLVTWPINLIPILDEIKIDGDKTVPTYSASLKSPFRDISGDAKIYYVKQEHEDLVRATGPAMQAVKAILNEGDPLPIEVKDQKINLEGQQLSVFLADLDLYDDNGNHTGLNSNGEIETNIPNTSYNKSSNSTHVFIDKSASKVTAKIKSAHSVKAQVKIRKYSQDKITKATLYNNVPVSNSSPVELVIDQSSLSTPTLLEGSHTILASSEVTGDVAIDQTSPNTLAQISGSQVSSGSYIGPVIITLIGEDTESGILKIDYSLDNGQTVQTYTGPFTISSPVITTIQFTATDRLGNQEAPQTLSITILTPTPTPTPTTDSNSASSINPEKTPLSASSQTSLISQVSNLVEVLGISIKKQTEVVPDKLESSVSQEKIVEKRSDPQLLLILIIPVMALTYLPLNIILSNFIILKFLLIKPTPK